MRRFIYSLLQPKSLNEDSKRQEFILNVILIGIIVLTTVCLVSSTIIFLISGDTGGLPQVSLLIILALFWFLYFLSRKGYHYSASIILIVLCFLPAAYLAFGYGFEVPQNLLTFAMILVVSGVLLGTRAAWIMTLIITMVLIGIALLQQTGIYSPDLSWRNDKARIGDAVVFAFTLFNITIVSWLSNREIERSLKRARDSEKELKKERDLLEIRVKKRTREIEKIQAEKIAQLSQFAEFGRAASSVFHDLVNPLTVLTLHLNQAKKLKQDEVKELDKHLRQAVQANKRMLAYIETVRQKLHKKETKTTFSVSDEIKEAMNLLSYKADSKGVKIIFEDKIKALTLYENPSNFNKMITNLVSNAIDALEGKEDGRVVVSTESRKEKLIIKVEDNGSGIKSKDRDNVFKPFFTTKGGDKGMGIGLSIVQEIIESMGGKITFETSQAGTTFKVEISN